MPVFQPFGKVSEDFARPILADFPQQCCQTNEARIKLLARPGSMCSISILPSLQFKINIAGIHSRWPDQKARIWPNANSKILKFLRLIFQALEISLGQIGQGNSPIRMD